MTHRIVICFMWFASVLQGATFTFDLVPSEGLLNSTPGSTVGWGYAISNNSSDEWLVTIGLSSDPFVSAVPNVLFDFPILAPGETITEAYDPLKGTGIMELHWSSSLAGQVVNTGAFVVDAQWWSGDPFTKGHYLTDAASVSQSYRAQAAVSTVPEPSLATLFCLGTIALSAYRLKLRDRTAKKHDSRRISH